MKIADGTPPTPVLEEAARELEAAIHDARVAYDSIGLGEIDRAHSSALTARVEIDAALTAVRAALAEPAPPAPGRTDPRGKRPGLRGD